VSVNSAHSLTLEAAWTGPTTAGQSYYIWNPNTPVLVCDGCLTGSQQVNTFGHVWRNLELDGNGVGGIIPYFARACEEGCEYDNLTLKLQVNTNANVPGHAPAGACAAWDSSLRPAGLNTLTGLGQPIGDGHYTSVLMSCSVGNNTVMTNNVYGLVFSAYNIIGGSDGSGPNAFSLGTIVGTPTNTLYDAVYIDGVERGYFYGEHCESVSNDCAEVGAVNPSYGIQLIGVDSADTNGNAVIEFHSVNGGSLGNVALATSRFRVSGCLVEDDNLTTPCTATSNSAVASSWSEPSYFQNGNGGNSIVAGGDIQMISISGSTAITAQSGVSPSSGAGGSGTQLGVAAGAGGSPTGLNQNGGAGATVTVSGGAGGAATGTGTNGTGGGIVLSPGAAGTGGSGGTSGIVTAGSSANSSCSTPAFNFGGATPNGATTGYYASGTNSITTCANGNALSTLTGSGVELSSAAVYAWGMNSSTSTVDTGVSRLAPGWVLVGNGTGQNQSGAIQSADSTRLTTAATIGSISYTTTNLVFPSVPINTNVSFHCNIIWEQASLANTVTFGMGMNNAPSSLWVESLIYTNTNSAPQSLYTTITNNMINPITGAAAPATSTVPYVLTLFGVLSTGTINPVTLTLYGKSGNASDALVVEPGSACFLTP
jgi:hypothetical protein